MYADLTDHRIAAPDDDLMDVRGDELAGNRIASCIGRSDGYSLPGSRPMGS
jgi:hypothetical protein